MGTTVPRHLKADPLVFPNVRKMLIRLMVLPVTSCEAERSFSTLRRVKTYLRSTMAQDRLTGLALMNVHSGLCLLQNKLEMNSYLKTVD